MDFGGLGPLFSEAQLHHPFLEFQGHRLFFVCKKLACVCGLFPHLSYLLILLLNLLLLLKEQVFHYIIFKQLVSDIVDFPGFVFEFLKLFERQLVALGHPLSEYFPGLCVVHLEKFGFNDTKVPISNSDSSLVPLLMIDGV